MKIYRAECEDGGGPYYHLDGTPRFKHLPTFKNSKTLYGADSLENLISLISSYGLDISNYKIVIYEKADIISYNKKNGHIIFRLVERKI